MSHDLTLPKKEKQIKIFPYLHASRILFLQTSSRDEALSSLVHVSASSGILLSEEKFLKALLEREKLVSTGIGMGVAIPHAKREDFADFFIAIGIQKKRGIEWNSLDLSLVRLIFMIGGPDQKQSEYLQILSQLTFAIKNEALRKKILQTNSSEEVLALFEDF